MKNIPSYRSHGKRLITHSKSMDVCKSLYPTGALLGACACTSLFVHQIVYFVHAWLYPRCLCLMNFTTFHRKENALIREMRLIKSTFFNTGTAAKYALNSEYTPNNAPVRYLSINAESLMVL